MDKLIKMLAASKMPNFLEVMAALDEISDVDWNRLEGVLLDSRKAFEASKVPKHPLFDCGEFCEIC